jgi:beta-lactamase regulating signal transducer with metallopeptidase domain
MSQSNEWLSADAWHLLALSLLYFLWQGLALAMLAFVWLAACRRASARYAIAVGMLAAMAVTPVVTYLTLEGRASLAANADVLSATPDGQTSPVQSTLKHSAARQGQTGLASTGPAPSLAWLVQIWFAGVLLLSVRTIGGLLVIARMRRQETVPVTHKLLAICVALERRMRLTRAIRYCQSLRLDAPAVAGWFRPVVFLPATALTGLSEAQIETVIAHELAHIRRLDGLVNLFQIAMETLLFYHPAVWWISKRIRAEREHCCDDQAIALCGNPVEYARALTLMEEWRTAPAMAMALTGNPLRTRIARLLGVRTAGSGLRSAGLAAGLLCLTAALLAGNVLVGGTRAYLAQPAANQQQQPTGDDASFVVTAPRVRRNGKPPRGKPGPSLAPEALAPAPTSFPPVSQEGEAPLGQAPSAANPTPAPAPLPGSSYIEQMKAAGVQNLDVDELVAMKVQGITPDYVRLMKELGIPPKPDELIGMKVQGITPEYVRQMRAITAQNLGSDELIGMKVQGITPDYVRTMKELGITPKADELVGMKVQGITAEYVKEMRAATGQNLGSDELIGLKVQGVTPDYVKELKGLGLKIDADDVIGMKVQGITPAYVQEMRGLGIPLDGDQLIGMKVQGITPAYVKGIEDLGLRPSADELIGMKVQGITAEYMKEMKAAGFKLDIDDAIGAKVQGVTPAFIQKARSYGFKDLTLEKIIRLKQSGVLDKQPEK